MFKPVRFTGVDWVTLPAREEKKEKTEFGDAVEDLSEEEMVKDIFCDALDLPFFYYECIDSTEIQGQWQRDFLNEKISRKEKEEEEEDSFSQGSRATTAKFQDIEDRGGVFF